MPFEIEPQYDRQKVKDTMQRIVNAIKADPTIDRRHMLAALGNVAGQLLATQFSEEERKTLVPQFQINIPFWINVYLQGERTLPM